MTSGFKLLIAAVAVVIVAVVGISLLPGRERRSRVGRDTEPDSDRNACPDVHRRP